MLKPQFLKAVCGVYWLFEPLLQDGIEPMWEDERNKRGGRWLITLNKQQRRSDLDRFWLETVCLAAVLCVLFSVVIQMNINYFFSLFPKQCIYYLLAAIICCTSLIICHTAEMSDYILSYLWNWSESHSQSSWLRIYIVARSAVQTVLWWALLLLPRSLTVIQISTKSWLVSLRTALTLVSILEPLVCLGWKRSLSH